MIRNLFLFLVSLLTFSQISIADSSSWISLTGGIQIDIDQQKVKIPITVINKQGGLEFIITIGDTKDYESIFSIKCSAKELHLALATVGFEPLGYLDPKENPTPNPKTKLELKVKFDSDYRPISDFMAWNDNKKMEAFNFYFCGSYFREFAKRKEYAADLDLNVVAAYPSREMLIGPLIKVGNPYQEEQGAYLTPNEKVLPAIGTNGWLLIQKHIP